MLAAERGAGRSGARTGQGVDAGRDGALGGADAVSRQQQARLNQVWKGGNGWTVGRIAPY